MTKFSFVAAFALLSAGLSYGADCVSDTAANYVTNFSGSTGCTLTIGGVQLLFNNFVFVNSATSSTTGGDAAHTIFNPIVDANGAGFDFTWSTPFTAGATGVNDDEIEFVASVVGGAAKIDDLYLSITGSAGAAGVGGGSGSTDVLKEDYCPGGTFNPATASCPGTTPETTATIPSGSPAGTTVTKNPTFALTNSIVIEKDIQLNGNNGTGSGAVVTDVKNQLSVPSTVPEPSQLVLLVVALCGLFGFRAWRQRQNA